MYTRIFSLIAGIGYNTKMTSASTVQWQSEVILDHTLMVGLAEGPAPFQVLYEVLGFLQAQIPRFAHHLDRLDLLALG